MRDLNTQKLFNEYDRLDFNAFTTDLLVQGQGADSLLFASLFLDEAQRNIIFRAYLKQQGYRESNPLFTAISILTDNVEELFLEQHLTSSVLPKWKVHTAAVLKTLA